MNYDYIITQEEMDELIGAAHSGAMLGYITSYHACLKI